MLDFSIFAGCSVFAGDKDIDEFIFKDAQRHYEHRMAVTYALSIPPDTQIIAVATLQNDAIRLGEKGFDGFPYKAFPAVKIGRLGVLREFQNHGIGSALIEIIIQFMCSANRTGCRFVTLDAYNNERVLSFYKKNNFLRLESKSKRQGRLTVPMYRDLLRG